MDRDVPGIALRHLKGLGYEEKGLFYITEGYVRPKISVFRMQRDGVMYAVKASERADSVLREAELLTELDVEGVPRCHGAFTAHLIGFLVMSPVESQSLWQYAWSRGRDVRAVLDAVIGASHVLERIHARGYTHMDVYSHNIFMNGTVCDLGEACRTGKKAYVGDRSNGYYVLPPWKREPKIRAGEDVDAYGLVVALETAFSRIADTPEMTKDSNGEFARLVRDANEHPGLTVTEARERIRQLPVQEIEGLIAWALEKKHHKNDTLASANR